MELANLVTNKISIIKFTNKQNRLNFKNQVKVGKTNRIN